MSDVTWVLTQYPSESQATDFTIVMDPLLSCSVQK